MLLIARKVAVACLLAGCFYIGQDQFSDIVKHPSSEWSSRDCLTIVLSAMQHNFWDQSSNIQAIATPYYPSVMTAISRMRQVQMHWSEAAFRVYTDSLVKDNTGLAINWSDMAFIDARSEVVKDNLQIDSLMFLVTLKNKSWPCNVPQLLIGKLQVPIVLNPADWPCYIPDITHLENTIFLANDKEQYMRPLYVWGKKRNEMTMDETLIVMFLLRGGSYHFLRGSNNMYLVIRGFEPEIRLRFDLAMMR